METFLWNGKLFRVDAEGFLLDHDQWDEDFAQGMAPRLGLGGGLTKAHWSVIHFIRAEFARAGQCPLIYHTCRANGLSLKGFKALFPTGYLRGACKLAGITYRDRVVDFYGEPTAAGEASALAGGMPVALSEKIYRVDALGFLVDPSEWDETFAANKAHEMKLPGGLTDRRRAILRYLRDSFAKNGAVPTVVDCCEANGIDLDELERLFPDGYHRGAVKIAGLRAR